MDATTTPTNLSELLDWISTAPNLTNRERTAFASAVRAIARAIGSQPDRIPTAVPQLRALLAASSPARASNSPSSYSAALSRMRKVMRLAGLDVPPERGPAPVTGRWGELRQALKTAGIKLESPLSRFIRWLNENGIAPDDVDTEHLREFGAHLETSSLKSPARPIQQTAARAWNKAVDRVPGWPNRRLEVTSRREHWVFQAERFPKRLQDELTAYFRDRTQKTDTGQLSAAAVFKAAFEDTKRAKAAGGKAAVTGRLEASSADKAEAYIREIATCAVLSGVVSIEDLTSLGDIFSEEVLGAAFQHLVDHLGSEQTATATNIASTLKPLARWLAASGDHPSVAANLDALIKGLNAVTTVTCPAEYGHGYAPSVEAKVGPFRDPALRDRLLIAPVDTYRRLADKPSLTRADLLELQTALAVEIELKRPPRRANLVRLRLNRATRLVNDATGDLTWRLKVPAREVKRKTQDIEIVLRGQSAWIFEHYVNHVRPKLVEGPSDFVFPGKRGALDEGHFGQRISAYIERATGYRLHVHGLRHFHALVISEARPGDLKLISDSLGHTTTKTLHKAYLDRNADAAARQVDDIVDARRQASAPVKIRKAKRSEEENNG